MTIDLAALEAAASEVFGPPTPSEEPVPSTEPEVPAEPEKPAEEPAKEPEKPAEDPKIAARLLAAKRQEIKIAQQRAELRQLEQAIAKQRDELGPTRELKAQLEAAKDSPSKLLELSGLSPKDFLEKLAGEHEPGAQVATVEARIARELAATRAELQALKTQLEARETAATRATLDAQVEQGQQAFLEHVASSAELYPNLVDLYTPSRIAREALAVAEQHGAAYYKKFGEYPSDSVIAEHLEEVAKQEAEERRAWQARVGKPSEGGSGELKQRAKVNAQGPRTLTSKAASEKASPPRTWDQNWADEESLRILEAGLSSKRSA